MISKRTAHQRELGGRGRLGLEGGVFLVCLLAWWGGLLKALGCVVPILGRWNRAL